MNAGGGEGKEGCAVPHLEAVVGWGGGAEEKLNHQGRESQLLQQEGEGGAGKRPLCCSLFTCTQGQEQAPARGPSGKSGEPVLRGLRPLVAGSLGRALCFFGLVLFLSTEHFQ